MRRLFCLSLLSVCLHAMIANFRAAYSAMALRNDDQEDPVEVGMPAYSATPSNAHDVRDAAEHWNMGSH